MLLALLLATAAAPAPILEDYAATAIGRFSTAAQHRADPVYDEVEAHVVRIRRDRTDGVWLYQEQAIVNQPGLTPDQARARPYFRFVARVTMIGPDVLRRDNFRVLSAGKAPEALTDADLGPASCHNRIERVAAGHWVSRTESCANAYKGAAFMQSLSLATPDTHANWDRGFTGNGARVWGPEKGGYIFKRVRD